MVHHKANHMAYGAEHLFSTQNGSEPIKNVLYSIAQEYPAELRSHQFSDIDRVAYHIRLVQRYAGPCARLADIGGGLSLFSAGCAALGMRAVLVDDFRDAVNLKSGNAILDIHRRRGVEILSRDVVQEAMDFPSGIFDAVTTFNSMEHWHHSPKRVLHGMKEATTTNGVIIIGVPNCVNLRKRMTVPFGIGKWSSMQDWYEPDVFRGHVREPDVDDLRYICNDLGLKPLEIAGRNWFGSRSRFAAVRFGTPFLDRALRLFPSLCSNLYLVGRRSDSGSGFKCSFKSGDR